MPLCNPFTQTYESGSNDYDSTSKTKTMKSSTLSGVGHEPLSIVLGFTSNLSIATRTIPQKADRLEQHLWTCEIRWSRF